MATRSSRSRGDGADADVYTLRDGKIVRAQIYTDTAMMERVFGRK
jgi:ketosteroid isomerase-like protein